MEQEENGHHEPFLLRQVEKGSETAEGALCEDTEQASLNVKNLGGVLLFYPPAQKAREGAAGQVNKPVCKVRIFFFLF